jgi:uncharacterized protein YbjQ (UPF0145 family)
MLVVTIPTIEGKKVVKYLGIVSGEVIVGANFVKDFFANLTDTFGGRSGAYENELIRARESALKEMEERAANLSANAILSVDIDYETIGKNGSMLMVSVNGTAVIVK